MFMNTLSETLVIEQLDVRDAIGTLQDCSQKSDLEGALGDYQYAWKTGRQILLGSHNQQQALEVDSRVSMTQVIFLSKDNGRLQRRATTWGELRDLLAEGWVVGTDRSPGVKCFYPSTGRAIRRRMEDIFVFRKA